MTIPELIKDLRAHSDKHLYDTDPIKRAQAAVEGVIADRLAAAQPDATTNSEAEKVATELTDIAFEHLNKLPPEEREEKIRKVEKRITDATTAPLRSALAAARKEAVAQLFLQGLVKDVGEDEIEVIIEQAQQPALAAQPAPAPATSAELLANYSNYCSRCHKLIPDERPLAINPDALCTCR